MRHCTKIFFLAGLALMALAINCPTARADEAVTVSAPDASAPAPSFRERLLEARDNAGAAGEGSGTSPIGKAATNMAQGFFSVVACLLLAASLYKRYGPQKSTVQGDPIAIVARKALSPRSALLVVTVEGRRLLLAQNSEQVSLVTDLSDFDSAFAAEEQFTHTDPTALAVNQS